MNQVMPANQGPVAQWSKQSTWLKTLEDAGSNPRLVLGAGTRSRVSSELAVRGLRAAPMVAQVGGRCGDRPITGTSVKSSKANRHPRQIPPLRAPLAASVRSGDTRREMRPITMYLIDGVSVPRKTYQRRQLWGEYVGARFEVVVNGRVARD